jgi:hypothetical protein
MKENRSLQLSTLIGEQLSRDLSMAFYEMFPFTKTSKQEQDTSRNRVFSQENTLLTMLLTMTNEDKSLQQSVNIYSRIHEKNKEIIEKERARIIEEASKENREGKHGRRRTTAGRIAKSKLSAISLNTSAYSQARTRIGLDYIENIFEESKKTELYSEERKWQGYPVYISDGTYVQMQDVV